MPETEMKLGMQGIVLLDSFLGTILTQATLLRRSNLSKEDCRLVFVQGDDVTGRLACNSIQELTGLSGLLEKDVVWPHTLDRHVRGFEITRLPQDLVQMRRHLSYTRRLLNELRIDPTSRGSVTSSLGAFHRAFAQSLPDWCYYKIDHGLGDITAGDSHNNQKPDTIVRAYRRVQGISKEPINLALEEASIRALLTDATTQQWSKEFLQHMRFVGERQQLWPSHLMNLDALILLPVTRSEAAIHHYLDRCLTSVPQMKAKAWLGIKPHPAMQSRLAHRAIDAIRTWRPGDGFRVVALPPSMPAEMYLHDGMTALRGPLSTSFAVSIAVYPSIDCVEIVPCASDCQINSIGHTVSSSAYERHAQSAYDSASKNIHARLRDWGHDWAVISSS